MDRSVSPASREAERGYQDEVHIPKDRVHPSRPNALGHQPAPFVTRRRSLNNIPSPRKDLLTDKNTAVAQMMTQFEGMATTRAYETVVHGELDAAQKEWQRLRKAFRKSRIQYETAIDPFGPSLDITPINQSIRKLREFCINDRSALESHSSKVKNIQRKLHLAENARSRSELSFMQSARKWVVDPGSRPLFDFTTSPPSTYTRQPGDSPTLAHSIKGTGFEKRYHSKVIEARSLGERLADLNYEYWNEVARRQLRQDHDETLSVTDEEFEEMHSRDKEVVSQELARVIEEAKKIRSESHSATTTANPGEWELLDLESAMSGNMNSGPHEGYDDSLQAALGRVPPEAFQNAEPIRGGMSEHASEYSEPVTNSGLVTTWMDDVPLGQSMDTVSEP